MTLRLSRATLAVAGLLLACSAAHAAQPFVHLQTDKERYRLGETLWLKTHVGDAPGEAFPLVVELRRAGATLATRRYATPKALASLGAEGERILIDPKWAGGRYTLRARSGERALHEVDLDVYTTAPPALRMSLRVLGEVYLPGQQVTAACRVLDRRGKPLRRVELRVRGHFPGLKVDGDPSLTDDEGWAAVRFRVPKEARGSGHLIVGLTYRKQHAAVAALVPVSASVGRIDAYPEGGGIVEGHKQRLGLLVRDLDGRPTVAKARVVDDRGETIQRFTSDRYGHALVTVPYAKERTYHVKVDRPAVRETFALPRDTGHAASLWIQHAPGSSIEVAVRWRTKRPKGAEVALEDAEGVLDYRRLSKGSVSLKSPRLRRMRWVVVRHEGRALLKAPILAGVAFPYEVRLTPRKGQRLLPGSTAEVAVQTLYNGQPVSAAVTLSATTAGADRSLNLDLPPALKVRSLLQPALHDWVVKDGADLLGSAPGVSERRTAYLLVRGGYALSVQGVPLTGEERSPRGVGRVSVPPMSPRPLPQQKLGETQRRLSALDAVMARAPWTQAAPHRPQQEPRVARHGRVGPTPGLGKLARRAPQRFKASWKHSDDRDTRFWQASLRTNAKGFALAKIPVGHETAPLLVRASGTHLGAAAARVTKLEVEPAVSVDFNLPPVLRKGDLVELWVGLTPRDGRKLDYVLELQLPDCLEALDRTQVVGKARLSSPRTKFRLRARSLCDDAQVRVVLQRGGYTQTFRRDVSVAEPNLCLSVVEHGATDAKVSANVAVPKNAVPGSVVVTARVQPGGSGGGVSEAVEGLHSLLRRPTGCFEQTTSSNYPNLVILEALLQEGADVQLLDSTYALATAGFERIKSFQHEEGGFSLWGPKKGRDLGGQQVRYTAMAVAQLARYSALFNGRGVHELQRALAWLDKQGQAKRAKRGQTLSGLSATEQLFAALAVSEAGLRWGALGPSRHLEPRTTYERALLANLLAQRSEEGRDDPLLDALLAKLAKGLSPKTGVVVGEGERGLMGSVGEQLSLEATALAHSAFAAKGWAVQVSDCASFLLSKRNGRGGWPGTLATCFSIRALATNAGTRERRAPLPVTLSSSVGGAAGVIAPGRHRPLVLERATVAKPGDALRLALQLETEQPVGYSLGLRYQVRKPLANDKAPYAFSVRYPAVIDEGGRDEIVVSLKLRPGHRLPAGQVVAEIALPGGLRMPADEEAMETPPFALDASFVEVRDGRLVVYWERAPESSVFRVPVYGRCQGRYQNSFSVIYPYYASGQETYARGRDLRVAPRGSSTPGGTGPAGPSTQAGQAVGAGSR